MKQYQVNNAYGALGRLANMQLPLSEARSLYMLAKKLENTYTFELEQERKLIAKYNGTLTPRGEVIFADEQDSAKFKAEMFELNHMDIEVEFEPVKLRCESFDGQKITPFDIACLDGFVIFE